MAHEERGAPLQPTMAHAQRTQRQYRLSLPAPQVPTGDCNLWSILKNAIGKELSKITMPVGFNEPLSFLQRMTEYMEYAHLLRLASEQDDPISRMQYVAAFAVSALGSNWQRLGKPFNPLLGETFELERSEFRIICEQVSHHPPVSAFHADSEHFVFHGSIHPKIKFWGKSVEITPKGVVTVELPKWKEAYTWTNVNCCVHNIIIGKLWIEQSGTMEVVNHSTGHRAILDFKSGSSSKDMHRVEGFIVDKDKKKIKFMYGKWTELLRSTDPQSYEDYLKENSHKFKSEKEKKDSKLDSSPAHTPKRVLAKLNSLKVSPFKASVSTDNDDGPDDPPEGDIPPSESTYSIDIPNSVTLWEADQRPENSTDYYNFTRFAMALNEIDQELKGKICPTDSRLRPDIRKLEEGEVEGAATEKTRLEEKQRETRKRKSTTSKKEEKWKPRWFNLEPNPHTNQEDWIYQGGYWERNFEGIEDIF
ncbi:hypothetical protein FOCC_FOCC014058 [Frankliniella occidentalis]|nr:hypothetical protein FOCC_FOCC014058 [Frankliniella occidentalis]